MIGTRVAFSNGGKMLKNGFLSSQHLKHLYLLGKCHISEISKNVERENGTFEFASDASFLKFAIDNKC
jgi:hypothetical protein